jgi:CBS domain-containing protein
MASLARHVMQPTPVTFAPDTPLLEIVHMFVTAHIHGAPVVAADGVVLGVVSATDLLRALDQACDDEIDAGERAEADRLLDALAGLTARDVATPAPLWVSPEMPLPRVATLMRTQGLHSVLVGDAGKLLGVLSAFDLLAALGT